MKTKAAILMAVLMASCETHDERWMRLADRPIVLTAESAGESIVLTDSDGDCLVVGPGYALSDAIAESYQTGDTIAP